MKTKKLLAIQIIFIMLMNLFLPYTVLLTESYAAVTVPNPAAVITTVTEELESDGVIEVIIGLSGDYLVYGTTFFLQFDKTKLTPATFFKKSYVEAENMADWDPITSNWASNYSSNNSWWFPETGEVRIQTQAGNYNPSQDGYSTTRGYDFSEIENQYNGFYPVAFMTFMVNDGFTEDDITKDLIKITTDKYDSSYPTGFEIIYEDDGNELLTDLSYVKYNGFTENQTKTVTGITVKTNPTKMTYNHGDTIDLTNGVLEVTYDDGSKEDISMTDSNVVTSASKANVNNTNLTLTYEGQSTTLTLTVNDPVDSLAVTSPMTTTEYSHDENIDFSGLELTATKRSGATVTLSQNSTGVTTSETKASVNSSKFTQTNSGDVPMRGTQEIDFSYGGKTVLVTIIVNDTISSVTVTDQPTKTVYKRGESLALSGSKIKVTMASGDTANLNLPNGNVTVTGYNQTTTGTKQKLKVSFGNVEADNTIDVEVYNYMKDIILIPPTNTNPNYGQNLDLNDASITEEWADGVTKADISVLESYVSGYTATKLEEQTVTVTYPVTYTLSDGTTIQDSFTKTFKVKVNNNITDITIKAPTKTQYNHGGSLDLTGGTITVTHAYGAPETVTMTTDMMKEADGSTVNMSPASYDNTNKVAKTLKITYEEDNVSKTIDYPITIINDIKSIAMHSTNHKVDYNVNESLDVTNAEILVTRATGTPSVEAVTAGMVSGFSSTTENTSLPLTVSYTENGVTKTTTYNVSVKDTVTGITMKTTPKQDYKYNEELNITGGYITVAKGSGTTDVKIESSMVTGYDKTKLGEQTVTVTYGGQTTNYKVNVKDYVTGIKVNPSSVTGTINDTMAKLITDNSITYTVTYAKAGDQTAQSLVDTMVSGYSPTSTAGQNLTVKYRDNDENSYTNGQDITGNLSVTLSNKVTAVSITAPTKTSYNHGQSLDLTTGVINLTYADNKTGTLPLSNATITEADGSTPVNMSPNASNYDSTTQKYSKTVKITYTDKDGATDTVNYTFEIINDVKSIAMHSTNHKVDYNVNESLDVTDVEILVTRATGTPTVKSVTESMVSGFSSTTENTSLPLTVSYTENGVTKTTTYNVSVKDTVTGITMKTTPKQDYKYNEELNITGGYITVTKGSGTTDVKIESSMVTGYDKTKLGEQTVTVTYGGQTTNYKVNVKDYVTGITINPSSVTGTINDTMAKLITDNSITYTVTYAKAGDQTAQSLVDTMVSGYNEASTAGQNLTVKYRDNDENSYTNGQDITGNLSVTLSNKVTGVSITAPTKTSYNHGQSLDLTTGVINLTYADNKTGTLPLSNATITEADGSTPVNMSPNASNYDSTTQKYSKTVKITYTDKDGATDTVNYTFEIINDVKSIAMHSTNHKVDYNVNESLDVTNAEILVTRATGTPSVVAVTTGMVGGFSSATENTSLPLTVSYTENGVTKTTTYNVSVKDTVTAITMKTTPKQDYKYNEELDITGGYITVTKGSGTTDVKIESSMVTGYDKTKLGEQTVTVTYGGQTTNYKVNVKDYVTGITVNPSSVTGTINDTMAKLITDNSITYTVTYAKAGDQTAQSLVDTMVSGYSPTSTAGQNLTVKYRDNDENSYTNGQDITGNLSVTLSNKVTGVSITAPTKTSYNHGQSLDLTTGVINLTYADNKTGTLPLSNATITETDGTTPVNMSPSASDYDSTTQKYSKTVKITYTDKDGATDTVNYTFEIINDVKSIAMHSTNHKVDYNVNESLDVTDVEILVTRATGTPTVEGVTESMVGGFSSATENTSLPLTVTYTENGVTKTTSYNVSVRDSVTGIVMKTTPKQDYKYNEELDITGGYITATKGSGTTDIKMESSMVTGYDKTKLGEQTITVTYGGQTTNYKVNVKDYVTGITINPSSVTGAINDTMAKLITDNAITYTVTYAKAGDQTAQSLVDTMVSGYNETSTAGQNLTVKYRDNDENSYTNGQDIIGNLSVTLSNKVTAVSITAPTKTSYNHGQSLDLTTGVINLTYADSKTGTLPLSNATITEADGSTPVNMSPNASDYDSTTQKYSKTVKITYTDKDGATDTVNYTFEIINDVKSIAMHSTNHKTDYNVGENLDVTDVEILVTRATGTPTVESVTESMVSGFSSTTENTSLPLTVSYTENGVTKTTNYNVSVRDSVSGIAMKTTPKQDYKYNEELDITGGYITVTKGSGTTDIKIESSMVTGYDKTKLGEQTVTVTYGGQTTNYKVNVKDYVTGITVNPSSVTGAINDTMAKLITDNAITYTVTYAKAGDQTAQSLIDTMVSGYSQTSETNQNLMVTYIDNDTDSATKGQTFNTNLGAILEDELLNVELETTPKTDYKYGETLDVSTGTLKVTKSSGIKSVAIEPSMITEQDGSAFDSTILGTRNLVITYGDYTMTYEITVKDYSSGILLTPPTKQTYICGETLDLTGGTVEKIWASGKQGEKVLLTDSSVTLSSFDSEKEGPQTIYVTWEGETDSFVVTVQDSISSISMNTLPKKTYRYGESLDVTGGTILETKVSGKTEVINLTESMVDGYDPNTLGKQTLTVKYKNQTTTYEVEVKDWIKEISIVKPNKLVYKVNESMDLTGGQVNLVMASGTPATSVAMTSPSVQVTGFSSATEGAKLIQVSYQGFTESFGITVVDELSKMTIKTLPNKLDYRYGESLNVTGGTIEIEKESGASEVINMTLAMVTGYQPNKLGNQTLTVTYEGFTQEFMVKVEDYISKLKVQAPSKVEYEYGEDLNLEKGTVSIVMASGKIDETVEMTASMVSGYQAKQEGRQTIKVEYKGLQGNFQVNVVDKIKGISIHTEPNKKVYNNGESIDLTGATIKVVKTSGTSVIPITADMISGYQATNTGMQVITVTYGGFTTKFVIEVKEPEKIKEPVKAETSEKVITGGNIRIIIPTERVIEEQKIEEQEINTQEETKPIQTQPEEEKPTKTLGVKDEKEDNSINIGLIAGIIGGLGLLALIILIIRRYNVKVYVEEDGEFVLIGIDHVSSNHPTINVDKYLEEDEYSSRVKIYLNKAISHKLDEEEIKVTYQEKVITQKIKYEEKPYEVILN